MDTQTGAEDRDSVYWNPLRVAYPLEPVTSRMDTSTGAENHDSVY